MKHFSKYADSRPNVHGICTKQKISPSVHYKKAEPYYTEY